MKIEIPQLSVKPVADNGYRFKADVARIIQAEGVGAMMNQQVKTGSGHILGVRLAVYFGIKPGNMKVSLFPVERKNNRRGNRFFGETTVDEVFDAGTFLEIEQRKAPKEQRDIGAHKL
jgi:hypothetical protein